MALRVARDDRLRAGRVAASVTLYATDPLGLMGEGWTLTGIDPDDIDLSRKCDVTRLDVDCLVSDVNTARNVLVELVGKVRTPSRSVG